MTKGSEATDNGYLILSDSDHTALLSTNPELEQFMRLYVGGKEFINGQKRWCFWLECESPVAYRNHFEIMKRLQQVQAFRLKSKKKRTVGLAKTPYAFGEIRQPNSAFLLIPKVSSERRSYIPIGYLPPGVIANGSALVVAAANHFHFGVITSRMHMAWMRQVCGRLESRYQYSVSIVYNNYPWPVDATDRQKDAVAKLARSILEVRQRYLDGEATLADLYDPLTMPQPLLKAHQALDRAVDRCYRGKKFDSDIERVELLFDLYEKMSVPLMPAVPKKRKKRQVVPKKTKSRAKRSLR